MGKTGNQIDGGHKNDGKKHFFLVQQDVKYKIKSDNLQLLTVIECLLAAGNSTPPLFVLSNGLLSNPQDLPESLFVRYNALYCLY